jgi:hypothetical protein
MEARGRRAVRRVLVTGSRDWDDPEAVGRWLAVQEGVRPLTLVHGDCPWGADAIADNYARERGVWKIERHPADWARYGKRAGFVRNAHMVDKGADICLAFIRNGSRGASMTATLAERAGIKTYRITRD